MSLRLKVALRLGELTLDVQIEHSGQPIVALVGPNGAGKSTLLRTIAGAHRPQSGEIAVDEFVFFQSEGKGARFVSPEKRNLAYLPQSTSLMPHLTGLQNVMFGLRNKTGIAGQAKAAQAERAKEQIARDALVLVRAQGLSDKFPGEMSGGEQKRVALARLIVMKPRLCLLDEPLSAIDLPSRRAFRQLLGVQLKATGVPALLATHDPRDVLELATHVCVLSHGKIVDQGTLEELRRHPSSEFTREFFNIA